MEVPKLRKCVEELNRAYIKLYGELFDHIDEVPPEQRDRMIAKLIKMYDHEYELLEIEDDINRLRILYEMRLRRDILVPRRRILWIKNRAARISGAMIAAEVAQYFAVKHEEIRALRNDISDIAAGVNDDTIGGVDERLAAVTPPEEELRPPQ